MFKTRKGVLIIYAAIWVLVLISPYLRYLQDISPNGWNRMIGDWTNLCLLLLVFLINLFVLVPRLLFKNRRSLYLIIVIVMIVVVALIDLIIHPFTGPPTPEMRFQPPVIPAERPLDLLSMLGKVLNNLIIALLIIGSSTALELEYKWMAEQKLRKDAEKEQLKTNLALLRHQVSPHFFMNTLNNIHSLIEMDSGKAQEAVERLSTLMRYLLYDSAQGTIELKKEIDFIYSFISLMELRHSEEVEVTTRTPAVLPEIKIPPMLFISLIENAFKHGVSYPLKSYIHIEISIEGSTLTGIVKNSKHKPAVNYPGEYSGIGLENIRGSLKLLYGDNFSLDIMNQENDFEVNITIPIG